MASNAAKIRQLINTSDGLLITAGAGMGVDSGLPDFRGNEGLWQHYPILDKLRIGFTRITCPDAFKDNPQRAWGFYGHRLQLYRHTQPHQGFELLKQLAQKFEHGYFVFTSNVDGQFQKAGFLADSIYECHGSIHYLQCMNPDDCSPSVWPNVIEPVIDNQFCELLSPLPQCKHCGQLARPNILMFNDWYWQEWPAQQQKKRLKEWLEKCKLPLVIEIGAGVAIPSIRYFSEEYANKGERLIRINPQNATIRQGVGVSLMMSGLEGIKQVISHA